MRIRRKKAATQISNWTITPSERDMKKWGDKFGYQDHELVYNVDLNMPDEPYAGYIGLGVYGSESSNNWGVMYVTTVTNIGGVEPWAVEYKVVARVIDGEQKIYQEGLEPIFVLTAKTRESCRTTKRNFFKELMREGYLALWEDVDSYVERWEKSKTTTTTTASHTSEEVNS